MESRSSWSGSLCGLRIVTTAAMLVAFLCGYTEAQWFPSVGNPSASLGNFFSGVSLSKLQPSDFKAGIFWGGGQMRVDHNILPGPAAEDLFNAGATQPAFGGFEHRRDTDLRDTFLSAQWGVRWGNVDLATLGVYTNIGKITQFKQRTSEAPINPLQNMGRPTLAVLRLPGDTEGVITLDNRNRIFNWDLTFAVPVLNGVQFLAGYQYGYIRSGLDPYSATSSGGFQGLPGITNWQNYWSLAGTVNTTGFTMTQRLWFSGIFIGARLAGGGPESLPAQWYVEGRIIPYAFGSYQFEWDGYYLAGGFFVNGRQTTSATGLKRYALEVKGGTQIDLVNKLFLNIWAKYLYVQMNGSTPEVQEFDRNFGTVRDFSQEANQSVTMKVNFWGVGGDLVLPF